MIHLPLKPKNCELWSTNNNSQLANLNLTLRILRMLMQLSLSHMTLLQLEFQGPKFFPQLHGFTLDFALFFQLVVCFSCLVHTAVFFFVSFMFDLMQKLSRVSNILCYGISYFAASRGKIYILYSQTLILLVLTNFKIHSGSHRQCMYFSTSQVTAVLWYRNLIVVVIVNTVSLLILQKFCAGTVYMKICRENSMSSININIFQW